MSKVDFKKTIKSYKAPKGSFEIVEVPKMQYLSIDGAGSPEDPYFGDAIASLYPVAYTLKFASKQQLNRDYVVPPLEALWWADDPKWFNTARDKSKWQWTVMLMTPDWIDSKMFKDAIDKVRAKKNPPQLDQIELRQLDEGLSVQTLHVGPFDDEGPVIEEMHNSFLPDNQLTLRSKHHEVYLSDFRRVTPDKLRTILRQPVRRTD